MRALRIAPYQVSRPVRRTKTAPGRIHFTRVEFPLEPTLTFTGSGSATDEQDDRLADVAVEQPAAAR